MAKKDTHASTSAALRGNEPLLKGATVLMAQCPRITLDAANPNTPVSH